MRTVALALALGLSVVGCGGAALPVSDPLAGSYVAATGESAIPLAAALTRRLSSAHAGMTWTVSEVGSGAAISLVATGDADVGFVTRELTPEDRTLVAATGLGYMGQVVAVNKANLVSGLTTEQLRDIFSGRITDWASVGGAPGPIRVFIRPDTSPTRSALDPLVLGPGGAYRPDAISVPDAAAMVNALAAGVGGIGMLSAPYVTADAASPHSIAIDGVAPSRENVTSGVYRYRRPVYLVTRTNASLVRPGARALLELLHSDEGRSVLQAFF